MGTVRSIQMRQVENAESPMNGEPMKAVSQLVDLPLKYDEIKSALADVSCTLVDHMFASVLEEKHKSPHMWYRMKQQERTFLMYLLILWMWWMKYIK